MNIIRVFETYKSHIELEKLTLEIIELLWKKIYKNKDNSELNLSEVSESRYSELKSFITDFNKLTVATSSDEKFKNKKVDAFYINDTIKGINYKYIYIYISTERLNRFIEDSNYSLFKNMYSSILLHELQHAYDDYRSSGKFSNVKISKEKLKDILQKYDVYYNVPHEVSAYITAYIYETPLYQWDLEKSWETGKDEYTIKPFDEVYKRFIDNISKSGFGKYMNAETKKKVIKKFVKFYNDEKENELILSYLKERETHLK